jgi:hypothetical protein
MNGVIARSLSNEAIFDLLISASCSLISRQSVFLFLFVWLYSGLCPGLAWLGDWSSSVGIHTKDRSPPLRHVRHRHRRACALVNEREPVIRMRYGLWDLPGDTVVMAEIGHDPSIASGFVDRTEALNAATEIARGFIGRWQSQTVMIHWLVRWTGTRGGHSFGICCPDNSAPAG